MGCCRPEGAGSQLGGSAPGSYIIRGFVAASAELSRQMQFRFRCYRNPYLRTRQTAEPTTCRFPGVPAETWPVQEFTDLSPSRCIDTTAEQRRPLVEAYWLQCDPDHDDGPGAESFSAMLSRVRDLKDRLAAHPAGCIAVFTHGQVMQALRLLDMHPTLGDQALMARFLEFDRHSPVHNGQMLAA